ncbi:MAG: family 20 glycosylhydrolase [Armatimonadetes bacterium]|nr:family 20 glycosylhydrolase [Armatimonadota bacterium]
MPEPVVPIRAIHLDLKGVPPTPERLISLLDVLSAAKYNAIVAEWEDTFPWTVDPRFRCETAYTRDEVLRFAAAAAQRGIEIISLVQCLGHMETPLSVAGYEHLREVPHKSDVLNPLAPGARELVQAMVDDVLELLPDQRYLHLGGDEAWSFGTHPHTSAYIAEHGKGALYLHHIDPILDKLNARGVRPILWHDMMLSWDSQALRRFAPKADLCVWGYGGRPDTTGAHHAVKHFDRLCEHGITMWGGTAYKGADGHNVDLPVWATREENAQGYADIAGKYGLAGVIATAWSRYSTQDVQCEPIDGALDCLVNVGLILHDGESPEGGRDACLGILDGIGERQTFEACFAALAKLRDARNGAWGVVRQLREVLTTATLDGRRRGAGVSVGRLKWLRDAVAHAGAAGMEVKSAHAGLVPALWLERYVAERVDPLREELGALEPRVAALEPAGYAALS